MNKPIITFYRLLLLMNFCAIFILASIACIYGPSASAQTANVADTPQQHMVMGMTAYRRGALAAALQHWLEAARGYEDQGKPVGQIDALIRVAEAQQSLGQDRLAVAHLIRALDLTQQHAPDSAQLAMVSGSLGNAYFSIGEIGLAEQYLKTAIEESRARELSDILVANLINLGNLRRYQKRYQDAYDAFAEAASLAHEGSLPRLSTKALVNALWVAVDRKDRTTFERWFAPALTQGRQLDDSHDKAYLLIALGRQAFSMTKNLAGESSKPAWITPAFEALNAALDVAKRIQDRRASSYALGYLGHLYEYTQRLDDALDLTRRAAFIAQQIDAPEILYLWQWQTGRILDAKGDMDGAITSYQNAIADLRTIRHELIKRYSFSGFNENVKPVFFELADLLLRYPGAEKDQARIKHSLTQALETLELLKSAELEDYFQDDCVAELQSRITRLDKPQPQTAVLYPILLEDRTELLLTLAKEIKHFTIPVNRATLTQEIRTLRRQMELRGESYLKPAQKLYDWLVRPMEKELNAHLVNTLVIVPDGPLRTIPLSTLHDGKKFLIERYALATTPGMTLTDPHPIKRENVQVLLSGLTEPVQGFPALPNVGMELSLVDELYPGALLIDDQFTIPLFREEMDTKPYQIVHMATHGQFESDLRNTFLLTFDDKLTMDRLEQLIGLSKFRDTPVELLILSACQTAAGDDRAALGLAGIAVKAGARSVLATLWAISDETAAELIPQFYRNLKNDDPPMSKAQALQQAQLKIIKTPSKFQHPFFWAPYLLIGNWL